MSGESSCNGPGANQSRVVVGDIARAFGEALRAKYALTPEQDEVLHDLQRCRTAALGGHLHVCEQCGYSVPMYNSCRNRHCPTCQSVAQHKWLERRRETLLNVPYFHVVFTLPEQLRALAMRHRKTMFSMLFAAASKTLCVLARDERRLGAMPAITMVLHTWTRELVFHPHVHAIVSAGGAKGHAWVRSRTEYLFPVKVMAKLFRRLFREALLAALDAGEISAPRDVIERARGALFHKAWHVYAKAPFGGGEQVFAYLGRYTHRVGISNGRILAFDARAVTFATKNGATCTLDPVEFLRRLLLHVLPKGFHKIRHCGLCSATHVTLGTLEAVREKLGPPPDAPVSPTALCDPPRVRQT